MEVKVASSDLALAGAAVGVAAAVAWQPEAVQGWLAALPLAALVANYVASGVYQLLIAHRGWRRLRRQGLEAELEAHENSTWGEFAKDLDVRETREDPSSGKGREP